MDNKKVYIDGVLMATATASAPVTTKSMWIGGMWNTWPSYAYNGKIYKFQIYKFGALVMDLIPSMVGPSFYDQVTHKHFIDGTGRVIYGADT
jgi:hypothetical protein